MNELWLSLMENIDNTLKSAYDEDLSKIEILYKLDADLKEIDNKLDLSLDRFKEKGNYRLMDTK